jgi:hypothetical protein
MSNELRFSSYLGRSVMDVLYLALGYWYCSQVGPGLKAFGVVAAAIALITYPGFLLDRWMRKSKDVASGHEED